MGKTFRWPPFIAASVGVASASALLFLPLRFQFGISSGPSGSAFLDALHFPFFIALTACLYLVFRAIPHFSGSRALAIGATAGSALLIAVTSEWVQGKNGRSMSATDLINDLLGAAVALAFLVWLSRPRPRRPSVLRVAIALMVAALAWAALPVFSAWRAEKAQAKIFPDLGGFSSFDAFFFWKPQGVSSNGEETYLALAPGRSTKNDVLYVKGVPAGWSGVSKKFYAGTRDWGGYHSLFLSIENLGKPFVLGIRVDGGNESISAGYDIPTGVTPIHLRFDSTQWDPEPPTEAFLSDVRKIVLHSGRKAVAHSFIVNDIRLLSERTTP